MASVASLPEVNRDRGPRVSPSSLIQGHPPASSFDQLPTDKVTDRQFAARVHANPFRQVVN